MNVQTQKCRPDRIGGFLNRNLIDSELVAFEDHLGECSACRQMLRDQTAAAELWDKAGRYLRDDQDEPDILSGESDHLLAQDRSHIIQAVLDALAPTDEPESLGRLGGLEVIGVVGTGAMGVVLKAYDKSLDRIVAVKVLAPHLASSGAARKRFAREARAAAAVLHPNVMAIHGVSNDESLPYLLMPYYRGDSLQKRLDQQGPLPLAEILRIGKQIAAGLAAAHAQGLVHRDIKPANILLEEGVERVSITDFGLARAIDDATLTRTGVIAGTPQFMSPEQARGDAIDQRSDLFSLGSVLYSMSTGHPPFRADSSYGVLRRITDDEPRPIREINPEMPEWLCDIIAKLMAKRAEDRFDSAHEVAELLEDCLAHVQQPTVVPLPAFAEHRPRSSVGERRRWPRAKAITAMVFAFVMMFAGLLIVLELNKGTLTIQCDADRVPVRITQGNKIVKEMIVTHNKESVRIAAGRYEVEVLTETDGLVVKNGKFQLTRGQEHVVTITREPSKTRKAPRGGSSNSNLWNEFGVTPARVSPLTATVLEWIGLHLQPITKESFRNQNVFANYAGGLDVTFVRSHGPAEKAGIHEVDIVVRLQGQATLSLTKLDSAVQFAIEQIKRGDADSFGFDVLRNGKTVRVNLPFPAEQLEQVALLSTKSNSQKISGELQRPDVLPVTGILEYDERFIVNVYNRVPARIEELNVDYTGVKVQKGDPLVTLFSEELFAAEEEFLQTHRLNEKRSRPQDKQLFEAAREKLSLLGLTKDQIDEIAKRNKSTGRLTLIAPNNGIITAKEVQEGQRVKSDARLFTIANATQLWARLYVNEAQLGLFRPKQPVTLTAHAFPGQTFRGQILFIEPTVDPKTRSIVIRVEVSNPQSKLKPGMSVTASVKRPMTDRDAETRNSDGANEGSPE